LLFHRTQHTPESVSQYSKGILHNAACPGTTVIEDTLCMRQIPSGIRLDHPESEWKGIIPDEKEA
jgi:hypothetical protein